MELADGAKVGSSRTRWSVIIAVFNEAGNIGPVTRQVREVIGPLHELIVVDDGSTDGTVAELDPAICTILRHERNQGKGVAIRTGLAAATGDAILFMDGDGQDEPKEIPRLVEALEAGADFVIGSRFIGTLTPGAITPVNRLGNRCVTEIFRLVFGLRLTDSQASFKGVRADKWREVRLQSQRYEIEAEMLIRAIRRGLRIVEVPVTRYPRHHGISHLYGIPFGRLKFAYRLVRTVAKGYLFWA